MIDVVYFGKNIHIKFQYCVHKTISDGWAGALSNSKRAFMFCGGMPRASVDILLLLALTVKKTIMKNV
jgi:hypothetical protein